MPTQTLNTGGKDYASATPNSASTSYLVPRTLLPEVINAVRKKLLLRGLAARVFGPSSIPGRTLVIPMQSDFTDDNKLSVERVGEGAEFPLTQTEFENLTITPVKYGARVGITREMQEDGILDLIPYHAELAGYEFADNEEALIVAQLDAAATASGNTVANSNATLAVSDVTEAMQQLEDKNYTPTHMIVGAEVMNDLRNLDILNDASKTGGPSARNQRMPGALYQMEIIVSNNVPAKLAYVIDASHAFLIAEKRPLTVERYNDYARDMGFVVISQRIAVSYLKPESVSEITTT